MPERKQPSLGDSITRGAFALLRVQPLTWAASLLWTISAPRLLGAAALGEVTVASTIAILAATVAGLGVSEFLVRRVAQRPRDIRRDAGIALSVQLVAAIVVVAFLVVFGAFLPFANLNYALLLAALLQTVAAPAQTVLLSSFRGSERHKNYALFTAAVAVVCPVGATLTLVLGGGAFAATSVFGLLMIATTLVAWKLSGLRPTLPRVDKSLIAAWSEFVRGGLPFLSWQLTLATYGEIDRLLLGALVPSAEVGWYAAAYRVIGMTVFVPTVVIAPLFPALSRSVHDPAALRRTITQTLRIMVVVMAALTVGSIAVAPGVPSLLGWPPDFENAVPLMAILALHLPIVSIDMVLGAVLMAIHREGQLVLIGAGAAVFNVAMNMLLIPLCEQWFGNGAIGAAVVTVLTEVFMCVGALVLIPKYLLDVSVVWHSCRVAVCSFISALLGLATFRLTAEYMPLLFQVIAAGLVATLTYAIFVVCVRAITRSEIDAIRTRFGAASST